jgi:hemolysin-activating ACP:hemolysin acyltransferase
MAVKILHETDTVVCGTENDGFRALGIMLSLAALAPEYASEQTFTLHERLKNAIDAKHYAIAYERQDRESPLLVPVGFITWGLLSKAAAIVFEKRFRPLYPTELKSGKHLWEIGRASCRERVSSSV